MANGTILVCDDKANIREIMKDFLEEKGFSVCVSGDAEKALKIVVEKDPDIVITDYKLPGMNGVELVEEIHRIYARKPVIVMTAFGSIPHAVEAMRRGAIDYLTKPIDYELLSLVIKKALDQTEIYEQNNALVKELKSVYRVQNLIGESAVMRALYRTIRTVATSSTNVLIQGECGTGKELIAKTIHYSSKRRDKPLAVVDCAALPDNLLESELFGYEKGAFTGASSRKKGRIEMANSGTLFLDEIGEMNLSLQAKLLRVIQEKRFHRIGGLTPVEVDFRLVAATNKDLQEAVDSGSFRGDLFYRLNVVTLHAPPLRHRKDDIPLLIEHFIEKISSREGIVRKKVARGVVDELVSYDWPGNVRELENCVERMILFNEGDLITDSFLDSSKQYKRGRLSSAEFDLNLIEKEAVLNALKHTGWNKAEAAKILNIGRKALYNKIKKFDIE